MNMMSTYYRSGAYKMTQRKSFHRGTTYSFHRGIVKGYVFSHVACNEEDYCRRLIQQPGELYISLHQYTSSI